MMDPQRPAPILMAQVPSFMPRQDIRNMLKKLNGRATHRLNSVHKGITDPDWDLDAIVGAFAAAAVDPISWSHAMEIASDHVGGCGAALFPLHGRLPFIPLSRSLEPSFESYIRDGWIDRDRRYEALPALTARGVG